MEFLNDVLKFAPPEWDRQQDYTNLFVLIPVAGDTAEYRSVKEYFPCKAISLIQRIQHPFAYGRFLIRKEQLMKENVDPQVSVRIERTVSTLEDVKRYIYYNCDVRRNHHVDYREYFIVKKVLSPEQGRDSDWYPAYLVTLL